MPVGLLALPPASCDDDKEAVVVCGVAVRRRRIEPGGRAFHAIHEQPIIQAKQRGKGKPVAEKEPSDDEQDAAADAAWRKKRKEGTEKRSALKLSPQLVGEDLYKLLEVSETSSVEQIKKQYRKLALQYHPDKHGGQEPGDASPGAEGKSGLSEKDMMFIKIQEAYEVLSDQSKRRQYDSSLDFDDDVPEQVDEHLGFYETFGPVFRLNARWSTRFPVPELGDEKTDMARVHKFYDFWLSFESWRDFSKHDEYNLDDAEFREERRWMERQNQKIRKKYQEAERRRVLKLVETAERLDPRIRAEREEREAKKREEKERRARAKQEVEEAKLRQEEERRQQQERERAEREEKERAEREQRKQNKQAIKTLRQKLRKLVQAQCKLAADVMKDLDDLLLASEATEPLEQFCDRLEAAASGTDSDAVVHSELEQWKRKKAAEAEERSRQRLEARQRDEQQSKQAKEVAAATAAGAPWSTEELGLLAKGLQRFPGGLGGRWQLITQLLNSSGFPRTEKEVVEKTKELSGGQSLRSMGSRVAAENTFQAPKAKAAAAKAAAPKAAPAADGATPGTAGSASPSSATPVSAKGGSATENEADWTPEQQKALEAALQRHPATLDKNERWRLIAEEVPGKTKSQCVERFKFLREQLLKQKG